MPDGSQTKPAEKAKTAWAAFAETAVVLSAAHALANVILGFCGAALAIAAFQVHPWQWNSAASIGCVIFAALFGGMALMFFILARVHDTEADNLRRNIAASRRFAQDLIARAQASEQKNIVGEIRERQRFPPVDIDIA